MDTPTNTKVITDDIDLQNIKRTKEKTCEYR